MQDVPQTGARVFLKTAFTTELSSGIECQFCRSHGSRYWLLSDSLCVCVCVCAFAVMIFKFDFLYLPGIATATISNFTVGHLPVLRKGDPVMIHVHPDPKKIPHIGKKISAGAPTFTVGGKPIARKGDAVSCGAKMAMGFPAFTIG